MVGVLVGARVGALVGFLVGETVGTLVGALVVGATVGDFVGVLVGEGVGKAVGLAVGALDGAAVVGVLVGARVGDLVGVLVGESVGVAVGAVVGLRQQTDVARPCTSSHCFAAKFSPQFVSIHVCTAPHVVPRAFRSAAPCVVLDCRTASPLQIVHVEPDAAVGASVGDWVGLLVGEAQLSDA